MYLLSVIFSNLCFHTFQQQCENILVAGTSAKDLKKKSSVCLRGLFQNINHFLSFCRHAHHVTYPNSGDLNLSSNLCCFLLNLLLLEWTDQLKEGLCIILVSSLCTQHVKNTGGQLLCTLPVCTENVGASLWFSCYFSDFSFLQQWLASLLIHMEM